MRAGLDAAGLPIPDDTLFLPALHLTHSDELRILPTPQPEQEPKARAHVLRPLLDAAERLARARRAGKDGVPDAIDDPSLLTLLRQKGHHWAETRPEWGLANNAFFIAAPRSRTAALNLDGRAFLQEYDWRSDPDARQLGGILGGPLVVAHWINMQYFASVADPERYGSGNKLLHNVVGGRIGVFEGNSGDLRIGLSLQSVHDGERWRHEPLRLAACIDAPARLMELALQCPPTAGCTCTASTPGNCNSGCAASGATRSPAPTRQTRISQTQTGAMPPTPDPAPPAPQAGPMPMLSASLRPTARWPPSYRWRWRPMGCRR